jgi:hypothetical protein
VSITVRSRGDMATRARTRRSNLNNLVTKMAARRHAERVIT